MGDVAAPALPVDRPAAALHPQIIRSCADDGEMPDGFRERQKVFFVFEQHQRFAHALPRDGAMFRRADGGRELRIGDRARKKPELKFDAQDTGNRVINARRRNFAFGHKRLQIPDELDVVVDLVRAVGNHDHVQAGIDGLLDIVFEVGRNLVNRRPVGHEKAAEAEFIFQNIGQQIFVPVHLCAIPTAVGNHDGTNARLDGGDVGRQVKFPQRRLVANRVALVNPVGRAAVADEMFRASEDGSGFGGNFFTLQADGGGGPELGDEGGVVAVAFVSPAPMRVLRDGDAGRKRPADAGSGDLLGRDPLGALDERGIMRRTHADVVRKHGGPINVVVAMHGINAVNERNFQARLPGFVLESRDHGQPILRRVAGGGIGGAAAQDRAEKIFLHVGLVLERAGIHLDHLADFFVERHPRQERGHGLIVLGK